ncbi:XRE family transcriptional regulator [Thermomonospora cellulosilytica]|uniref:Transcriptional regulator with XRE-family HTH domain n=1 Tax=Thermomonospora cellulosilytica TaxID=1411118 RepID=A0A7W3R792_9ACTN|nr:XRE family transcriptional regulator [Thermomonospora cellulosilytica]MBA9002249.1 transcriptional regulator with XRE-family HTH domain [Thermomonospora cellulosilytica]
MAKETSPELPALGRRLRAERERRGWGRRTMARHLLDHIDDRQKPSHVTVAGYIKNWEAGEVRITDPRYRAAYAAALGIPEDELFALPNVPVSPPGTAMEGLPPGTVMESHTPGLWDDEMRRRAVLELLAAVTAGQAVPSDALETIFTGVERVLGARTDVDEWERVVAEYDHLVSVRPVGSLINDMATDVAAVGRILDRPLPPAVSAGMLRVSAGLSGLLAAQFEDVGQRQAARMTWSMARRAADASGDRALRVWVRSKEASMARWSDRPPAVAAELADEAVHIAGGTPCRGLAQAHAVQASLAARRGDVAGANEALQALEEVTEQGGGQRYLHLNEAYVHTLTHDRRAGAALSRALDLSRPGTVGRKELDLIQAMGLVREREINAGLQHALTTVQGGPLPASGFHIVGHILHDLPPSARTLPAARELRALTAAV